MKTGVLPMKRPAMHLRHCALIALLSIGLVAPAGALDEDDAKKLAKKSGCLKCHAIDKKKEAPPLKEIAAKYKDKADAKDTLFTHLTTNPTVEVDGKKEKHESLKTDDEAEIRNVIEWVLSQ
jgi:cytochrome c